MKKFLKPLTLSIVIGFILMAISYTAMALVPFFTQKLVSRSFKVALIGYGSCTGIYLLMNYLYMRLQWWQNIKFSNSLKNAWFDSLLNQSYQTFSQRQVPQHVAYQANDLDALEKDYLQPLLSMYQQIMRMIIFLVVIAKTVNLTVSILLLVSGVLTIQVPKIIGKLTATKRGEYLKQQGNYYDKLTDLLSGFHLINQQTIEGFRKQQRNSLHMLQRSYIAYGFAKIKGLLLNAISFEVTGLVLFVYLAYALWQNQITTPEVVASMGYLTAFSEPFQEILYDVQMLASVQQVKMSFLALVGQPVVVKQAISDFSTLSFKQVEVTREAFKLRISDLEIHAGDKIALVGDNGTGKSTLLNVLRGVQAYSGLILIDGQVEQALEGKFSAIIQREHEFNTTFDENISVFDSFNRDDALEQRFQLNEISKQSENQTQLSGGQKQLVHLVRLLGQRNPMLLLDEPFSALDQQQFEQALEYVLGLEQTVLMIIHQKDSYLEKFDRVWKFFDGGVVERFS
ncbi:MAG: ABC transporter ATP-binding protein/permease [Streptococcaceae bacterium]|nr:ABC transporter ATP-binding protein/permease [Streptococcaceae bacterium]